jgi:protein-disulfide isomerase
MSSKKDREKRREERLAQETKVEGKDQRKRILQIGAGAVFVAVVVVAVLIVASGGGSDDGGDTQLEGVATVDKLVEGIPQEGLTIGDPKAPVRLIEFGDLQCPVCKAYAEEILPPIVEKAVKNGEAQIEFRNFTIIGPESITAGTAALAAGEQGRGWEFLDLFYHNQGEENGGYVTDSFLAAVAKGAGVKDIAQWEKDRKSKALEKELNRTSTQAQNYGFTGTPSFAVEGPKAQGGIELIGTPGSTEALEEAIAGAG